MNFDPSGPSLTTPTRTEERWCGNSKWPKLTTAAQDLDSASQVYRRNFQSKHEPNKAQGPRQAEAALTLTASNASTTGGLPNGSDAKHFRAVSPGMAGHGAFHTVSAVVQNDVATKLSVANTDITECNILMKLLTKQCHATERRSRTQSGEGRTCTHLLHCVLATSRLIIFPHLLTDSLLLSVHPLSSPSDPVPSI